MVNFVELHKKLWTELADTKAEYYMKDAIVRRICSEYGISRPRNNCFLCEDTIEYIGVNCYVCKGNWSPYSRCDDDGYYTQWREETNPDKRAKLAYKIANICY